ncbi:choice-of-anchor P family protein [Nocardioides montaniterrae]
MKHKLISATAAVVTAVSLGLAAPAHAVNPKYGYIDHAGATQVNALGLMVQSNPTANSDIYGSTSKSDSAHIASANAGTGLLDAGAATTSTTATTNSAGGVKVVAHAKTAGISLLGGLIKADAIDTVSTINADGVHNPTTAMTTSLLGLTINGKSYPASFAPNKGILIPGVVSIGINTQATGTTTNTASVQGAGLKITLLAKRNGADAGATVMVNPISQLLAPAQNPDQPGYALGGRAYGSYVHAAIPNAADISSTRTAQVMMPTSGTWGKVKANNVARATVSGVLNIGAVHSEEVGSRTTAASKSFEKSTVGSVNLFNGLIKAGAVGTSSRVKATSSGVSMSGAMTFVSLTVAGKTIPLDVKPNTTINVLGLGTVTLNERKRVTTGGQHSIQTTALHIVLDTARAGLPVGAEVQLAVSKAIVYK